MAELSPSEHLQLTEITLPPTDKFVLASVRDQLEYDPGFVTHGLARLTRTDPELARHLPAMAHSIEAAINNGMPVSEALMAIGLAIHQTTESQLAINGLLSAIPDNIFDTPSTQPPEAA